MIQIYLIALFLVVNSACSLSPMASPTTDTGSLASHGMSVNAHQKKRLDAPSFSNMLPSQTTAAEPPIHNSEKRAVNEKERAAAFLSIMSAPPAALLVYKIYTLIKEGRELSQKASRLLQQLRAYQAQVPSERMEDTRENLLQQRRGLSKEIQAYIDSTPGARFFLQSFLNQLDAYRIFPSGNGVTHTRLAQTRFALHYASHLADKTVHNTNIQLAKLQKERQTISTAYWDILQKVSELSELQTKLTDNINNHDGTDFYGLRSSLKKARKLLPDLQIEKHNLINRDQLLPTASWVLIELSPAKENKEIELNLLKEKLDAVVAQMDNLTQTLTSGRRNPASIPSFGIQNLGYSELELGNLYNWLFQQTQIETKIQLSLTDGLSQVGHAILIAADPNNNQYGLFDPNTGFYLWDDPTQFAEDVYTYLVRVGLEVPNPNVNLLDRDLDLRPRLKMDFSQANIQAEDIEEGAIAGPGLCFSLSMQVGRYLFDHPGGADSLTPEGLGIQGIYTPAFFMEKSNHYMEMGMLEKSLAMLNYWLESQPTTPFAQDQELRTIYKKITSYGTLLQKNKTLEQGLAAQTITKEHFDTHLFPIEKMKKEVEELLFWPSEDRLEIILKSQPEDLTTDEESLLFFLHELLKENHLRDFLASSAEDKHLVVLYIMLLISKKIFDKYQKADGTWKESELRQIFSWLYTKDYKHVYPKPQDGFGELTNYDALYAFRLGLAPN